MHSYLVWSVEFYAPIHKSWKLIFYVNSQGCSVIVNYYRKIISIIFPRIAVKKKFGFDILLPLTFAKHSVNFLLCF